MLHLFKALQHSQTVSHTRDHVLKHMSLKGAFHIQTMTSDCSFLYPGHLAFVLYVLCKQHHALLWSIKYKEKGQELSLCLSVLAVSHNGVCVTRLVLLGAF